MNKNILIASHKNMITEGFCLRLQQEPDLSVIGWVETQAQFEAVSDCHSPDAILMCSQFLASTTPKYIRDVISHYHNANILVVSNMLSSKLKCNTNPEVLCCDEYQIQTS